jgi:hypothetical protein
MAFLVRGPAAAVTSAATTVLGTISLGAPYALVLGFVGANWASSAMAAEGTDAAEKVKLTDADGKVIFLDAADRDYGATSGPTPSTDGTYIFFTGDPTTTGLTVRHTDATGAVLDIDEEATPDVDSQMSGMPGAFAKSPVSVEVQNAGTPTDYFTVYLFVQT